MNPDGLRMSLLASAAAPGLVRTLVEQRLMRWELLHRADDALLVTGELVTNAVNAAPGRELWVRFTREAKGLLLEVWDPSDRIPESRSVELDLDDGEFDAIGGWGLHIVQALSLECGYARGPDGGKTVWALLKP